MRTIICTTGTSVAGPGNPMFKHPSPEAFAQSISDRIAAVRREHENPQTFMARISAETNGLQAMKLSRDDSVALIHTETEDGRICAEMVAKIIEMEIGRRPALYGIKGLQVTDAGRFRREGIQNLVDRLDTIHSQADRESNQIILNVTGGFKGVVPYATLYGLLRQLDVVYLFEQSNELIHLPREEFFRLIPGCEYHQRDWFESLLDTSDAGRDEVELSSLGLLFLTDVSAEESNVFIGPRAAQQLEDSRGAVRDQFTFMLARVGDPLWRRGGSRHAFSGTDLAVFKPGGTSERMACILRGDAVYVCELLQHDEYERVLPTRREAQYKLKEFVPWQPPADTPAPPSDTDILEQLAKEKQAMQGEVEQAKLEVRQAEKKLQQIKNSLAERAAALRKEAKLLIGLGDGANR